MAELTKKTGADSLQPTEERVMDTTSYFLMQIANGVAIAVFTLGAGFVGQLNFFQSFTAMFIGTSFVALLRSLNGAAGISYGIPFTIQLRSAFGVQGAKVGGLVRAIPGLVWYGFQTWIGGEAINMILNIWLGFDNVWVCFIGFQIVHILATRSGFKGIKWLENIGAVFITFSLAYMFYVVFNEFGVEVQDTVMNIKGSWGLPFITAIVVMAGNGFGVTTNMSDLSRNYEKGASNLKTFIIYILGLVPITMFMALIGLLSTGATGSNDPVDIFVNVFDNNILLVITLLFVAFSQLTTNVLSNSLPPVYVFMDILKISFNKSVLLVGVLPFLFFPWLLVTPESSAGFNLFIRLQSGLLGPLITIMLIDYYIIRKRKLNIDYLYALDGPYKGINPAAIIALIVGFIVGVTFVELTWLASFIPTGIVYYVLMKKMPQARRFMPDTESSLG